MQEKVKKLNYIEWINTMKEMMKTLFPHITNEQKENAKQCYPNFKVFCSVVKARSPRHPYFEYIINIGMGDIDRVFSGETFNDNILIFIFPERHMSVHEQYAFMKKLKEHPDALANKIETILILTSSPLIVGNFYKEQVAILTWDDDRYYND